jgi:AAA domain, putative AbiEii toxin, Type IV TA system
VLEEPEMGLHPRAILAVMLLVLELLGRGYKVVLSTHHPLVLDVVWALLRIKERASPRRAPTRVLEMFQMEEAGGLRALAAAALKKEYRVVSFGFRGNGRVVSTDISNLDPASRTEQEAGWGGLAEFSGHISDVVARVVNE